MFNILIINNHFSSVDLLLERLCLEGSRKQAKYSVQALASITKDDGLKALSVLYKVIFNNQICFYVAMICHLWYFITTETCGHVRGENSFTSYIAIIGMYCPKCNASFWNQGGWNYWFYPEENIWMQWCMIFLWCHFSVFNFPFHIKSFFIMHFLFVFLRRISIKRRQVTGMLEVNSVYWRSAITNLRLHCCFIFSMR